MSFRADDHEMQFPIRDYTYDIRRLRQGRETVNYYHEVLRVMMPVEAAARIGQAVEVTGRTGPIGFTLSSDQLAAFRAIAAAARQGDTGSAVE